MDSLMSDLANCSYVRCPCTTASVLCKQYTRDINDLLDKYTPDLSCIFIKGLAKWLSDSYLLAKSIRHQFEHIWHKGKSPQNRAKLHKQIASCNSLVNEDKSNYYRNLINKSARDTKKL